MASITLTEEFQNWSAKNILLMLNAVCETKKQYNKPRVKPGVSTLVIFNMHGLHGFTNEKDN
jgi:hypothetical protein